MDTVINGLYGSKNRIIPLQMGFKWFAYSNQAVHLHCSFWVYVTYVKTLLNYGNFTLLPWYWRWRRLRHHCCFVITRILPHIALHYMHIEIRTRKRKSFFLNEKRSLLEAYNKLIKKWANVMQQRNFPQATLRHVLKQWETVMAANDGGRKRICMGKAPVVEDALCKWIDNARPCNAPWVGPWWGKRQKNWQWAWERTIWKFP